MKLFKRTSKHPDEAAPPASPTDTDAKGGSIEAPEEQATAGLYGRLKNGLSRTGSQLASGLGNLFLGKKEIDDELLEALEEHLVMADVGMAATARIIADITGRVSRRELGSGEAVMAATRDAFKNHHKAL